MLVLRCANRVSRVDHFGKFSVLVQVSSLVRWLDLTVSRWFCLAPSCVPARELLREKQSYRVELFLS